MRAIKLGICLFVCVSLVGCVTSLIVGNQMQYRLMGALIKPLVGFDPNDVNLFEIPVVKERMTQLLGDHYEPTMTLLRTAQEIQQEGALYYVVSRYAPEEVTQYTDQAAMIWNADTNQLAVMLIQDRMPTLFSEQIADAKAAILPVIPTELVEGYEQALAYKKAAEEAQEQTQNLPATLEQSLEKTLEQSLEQTESYKTYQEAVVYRDAVKDVHKQAQQLPINGKDLEKEAKKITQKRLLEESLKPAQASDSGSSEPAQ